MCNNKSKFPDLPSGHKSFQNRRNLHLQGYPTRVDEKNGPFRCLSDGAHSPQGQEIPENFTRGAVLPIQKFSLQISMQQPLQRFTASSFSFAQHRDQVNPVFG